LVFERAFLDRRRSTIPLRIAVTGTRGKSSVTRMLASVLRESGRKVLAKTTGSEATIILPDGVEREVKRRGRPSIMEQKQFVRLAADQGVDAAVAEVMSIHAENHFVEVQQLLKPHMVLVTNFRADHTAAMGKTRDDVASVIALDVLPEARVYVMQQECPQAFREEVEKNGAELVEVRAATAAGHQIQGTDFSENFDLVFAAARSLGIDDETTVRGIGQTRRDMGALGVWRYSTTDSENTCLAVNAFAANDPESTMLVHDKVATALGVAWGECIGLLSLRADRGDRTVQWAEFLEKGAISRFSRLYVSGHHAPALARRVRRSGNHVPIEVLRPTQPPDIMKAVLAEARGKQPVVFGFGNIGGLGKALVTHWNASGFPVMA
jgi:poly-gamma-glutamate synthase PgsB/CapB